MFVFWLVGHNSQNGLSKHFLLTLKVQNLKISLVSLARVKAYGTYLAGELKIDNEKSNENNVVHFEIRQIVIMFTFTGGVTSLTPP